MMTGFNGLNDANIITKAHMDDTRQHLQAIRDAEAADNNKPNRIKQVVQSVVSFAKRFSTKTVDHKATDEIPQMKLNNEQV